MFHAGNDIKKFMKQLNRDTPALVRGLGNSKQDVYLMLEKRLGQYHKCPLKIYSKINI